MCHRNLYLVILEMSLLDSRPMPRTTLCAAAAFGPEYQMTNHISTGLSLSPIMNCHVRHTRKRRNWTSTTHRKNIGEELNITRIKIFIRDSSSLNEREREREISSIFIVSLRFDFVRSSLVPTISNQKSAASNWTIGQLIYNSFTHSLMYIHISSPSCCSSCHTPLSLSSIIIKQQMTRNIIRSARPHVRQQQQRDEQTEKAGRKEDDAREREEIKGFKDSSVFIEKNK